MDDLSVTYCAGISLTNVTVWSGQIHPSYFSITPSLHTVKKGNTEGMGLKQFLIKEKHLHRVLKRKDIFLIKLQLSHCLKPSPTFFPAFQNGKKVLSIENFEGVQKMSSLFYPFMAIVFLFRPTKY
jgi:hypothetical protein